MYDFRTLSPLDFEELVRDLLQAEFSLRMESFGPGRDLGIDFRFANASGRAIVQAKHYIGSSSDSLVRAARRENEKVLKLKPTRYILATSVSLTPHLKSRLQEAMPGTPLAPEDIIGRSDLNNLLGRHVEIEKKNFKLWLASTAVLERILHSGVYNRTQAEMDVIKNVVPKFVTNNSVPRAEEILKKHNALIIAGEPGVGKSTLARMLVWLHAEQSWKISVVDEIKEAFEVVTDGDKHLIFFDDFLGQVRLSADLVREMDQRFPPFLEKVRMSKNIRFILTTRDYILHQAQSQSSRLSAPSVNATEFTLNVGFYTRDTKAQMLFNHLYFSDLSEEEKHALLSDDFFLKIIDHRNFNPRLIQLLTSADYVSIAGVPIRTAIESVLENPQELWEKPYRTHISDEGRAVMLALFFNSERTWIEALERSFGRMVTAMGLSIARSDVPVKFRSALKELEGSVFAIQDRFVRFSNPGVRDFLQRAIIEDRFIEAAIEVITEYSEALQTWTVFKLQNPSPDRRTGLAVAWANVAARLVRNEYVGALDRVILVIEMYDYLQTDEFLDPVSASIAELKESEIEGSEIFQLKQLLEQLTLSLLPMGILDEAKSVVSSVVAKTLVNYGGSLTLDDIKTVSESLVKYGADEDAATDATRAAIESYVDDMFDTLSEIQSLEELASYERELTSLMSNYGVYSSRVESRIESRRESIIEEEQRDNDDEYGGHVRPTVRAEISDDQIRSMFGGLKRD